MTRFGSSLLVVLVPTLPGALAAQKPDRTVPPKPGAPPALRLPAIQKQSLPNGLAVWIVEQHEVPLVQVNLLVKAGSGVDPAGEWVANATSAAMLDEEQAGSPRWSSPTPSKRSARARDEQHVRRLVECGSSTPARSARRHCRSWPMSWCGRRSRPPNSNACARRLTRLLQARDDPAAIVELAFPRLVLARSISTARPRAAVEAAVKALTLDDLPRFTAPITDPSPPPCLSSVT